jgi:tetratricopeptide (TPR) repeat protein
MIALHVGLGERGKQLALGGQHVEALRHYREAMQQATRTQAPEVFLRHYTQCALESLERLGALDEVLATCGRAREHYRQHPPGDDVARKDQASFLEREGIVLLRQKRLDEARACFTEAMAAARPARAPLAETLLGWLRANLHVAPQRLERELTRQKYWSVRADSLRAEWAVPLPDVPAH